MRASAGQFCNAAQVKARSTCDLLRARWCEPVLSVVDIRVGDDEEAATDPFYRFGPTRFSVIPRSAVGNVSVRFVPDQVCPFLTHRSRQNRLVPSFGWLLPRFPINCLSSCFVLSYAYAGCCSLLAYLEGISTSGRYSDCALRLKRLIMS